LFTSFVGGRGPVEAGRVRPVGGDRSLGEREREIPEQVTGAAVRTSGLRRDAVVPQQPYRLGRRVLPRLLTGRVGLDILQQGPEEFDRTVGMLQKEGERGPALYSFHGHGDGDMMQRLRAERRPHGFCTGHPVDSADGRQDRRLR